MHLLLARLRVILRRSSAQMSCETKNIIITIITDLQIGFQLPCNPVHCRWPVMRAATTIQRTYTEHTLQAQHLRLCIRLSQLTCIPWVWGISHGQLFFSFSRASSPAREDRPRLRLLPAAAFNFGKQINTLNFSRSSSSLLLSPPSVSLHHPSLHRSSYLLFISLDSRSVVLWSSI